MSTSPASPAPRSIESPPESSPPLGRVDLLPVVALLVSFALIVACVGIGGDYPLNDDWAYAYTARYMAQTGKLRILDWAAPGLLSHAVWGAALLRWVGDSYVVLRCGTLAFAAVGMVVCYILARQCGLAVLGALLSAWAMGFSPWYVNLSFTYMTDVPWLVWLLASLVCACAALPHDRPRPIFLVLSGGLLGVAALTRQFAVITLPGFLFYVAIDSRRRHGAAWWRPALGRGVLLCLPVLLMFGSFQRWYTHVHGATVANRETWTRMLEVGWHPLEHAVILLHYFGLFISPLAMVLWLSRRPVSLPLRGARIAWGLLAGYALFMAINETRYALPPSPQPYRHHQTMPYLDNIFHLLGLGPPTILDSYLGVSPPLHSGLWFGVLLTVITTISGVYAIALLRPSVRLAWGQLMALLRAQPAPIVEVSETRALLLGAVGTCYLLWHLCTGPFIFDRYLLPVLPLVFILALRQTQREHWPTTWKPLIGIGVIGLLSLLGTREYLAWNQARDTLVRRLEARGVPSDQIDGGFEVNGARRFITFFNRTGQTTEGEEVSWWAAGSPYRISFHPAQSPACQTLESEPFFSLPRPRAMYLLRCHQPVPRMQRP
ncbi:MAG TPA: glycosyltransferase family 39 protein [Pseudomonadota bacterium]|nr:glycosyltransferase family 39 protein [Pseudomonadota bacterium]